MTLNEVNIIKNSVLDATEAYVDARLNSSDFVKTQIGVTSGNPTEGTDGKYRHTVVCNKTAYTAGVTYTNVLSVGNVKFPPNSVVFLIAPNAQYSNQFILGKLDNTPANIVGGTIKIGRISNTDDYYFSVNDTGNVTIKGVNSSIKLAQDGTTNYYHVNLDKNGIKLGHTGTGDTYNFTVDATTGATTIRNGSINLSYNSTVSDYNFKVDSNGINLGVTGTSSSNKAYNFVVNSSGVVTIKSGSINLNYNSTVSDYGIKLNSNGIYLGVTGTSSSNKAYNFTVSSAGVVTIKSGSINLSYNSTVSDYNFKVDSNGINLGVTGTSSSNKAYNFVVNSSGVVTIKSGSINLTYNSSVSDYNFKVDSTGIKLGVTGTTSSNKAYNFVVNSAGTVTIKSGSILLGATTISGNLGYNVNLNSSGLGLGYLGYSSGAPQYNFTVSSGGIVNIKNGIINLGAYTSSGVTKYKFSVDDSGQLIATYGYVGGFEITSESIGDPLGSSTAIGMKNKYADTPSLYAWTPSSHIEIKPHELNLDNANINVDYGSNYVRISAQNIRNDEKGYVVWHSELSDERYKKNIKEISPNDIEIFFNKVTPSIFKFKKKANMDNLFHCGVIAQNLKEALNQTNIKSESLVRENKYNVFVVDYQELHGLELAGIKNLYRIIQTQQQEIDMLKKQLGV